MLESFKASTATMVVNIQISVQRNESIVGWKKRQSSEEREISLFYCVQVVSKPSHINMRGNIWAPCAHTRPHKRELDPPHPLDRQVDLLIQLFLGAF